MAIPTRLRLGLRKSYSHKFNHHLLDTVYLMCLTNDGIEDTEFFLLKCHAYDNQRRDLFSAINEVLQLHNIPNLPNHTLSHIILFGGTRFTHNQDGKILESKLKFIHSSECFLKHQQYQHRQISFLSHPSLLLYSLSCYYSNRNCIENLSSLRRRVPKSTEIYTFSFCSSTIMLTFFSLWMNSWILVYSLVYVLLCVLLSVSVGICCVICLKSHLG